jgi:hypothetical protein
MLAVGSYTKSAKLKNHVSAWFGMRVFAVDGVLAPFGVAIEAASSRTKRYTVKMPDV